MFRHMLDLLVGSKMADLGKACDCELCGCRRRHAMRGATSTTSCDNLLHVEEEKRRTKDVGVVPVDMFLGHRQTMIV